MIRVPLRVAASGTAWLVALCSLLVTVCPSAAQDAALDALVRAYPDFLSGHDGKVLIWKDWLCHNVLAEGDCALRRGRNPPSARRWR